MENFKLYITESEYILVNFKIPSLQVEDDLLKLNVEFAEKYAELQKQEEFKDVINLREKLLSLENAENLDLKMLTDMNLIDNNVVLQKFTYRSQMLIEEYNLRKLKVILDKSKLDDETKKKFDSSVNSEFWRMQNIEEVNNALEFFRKKFRI